MKEDSLLDKQQMGRHVGTEDVVRECSGTSVRSLAHWGCYMICLTRKLIRMYTCNRLARAAPRSGKGVCLVDLYRSTEQDQSVDSSYAESTAMAVGLVVL